MSLNASEDSGTYDSIDDHTSPQKPRGRRSKVWEHFESDLINVGGNLKAVCKYCKLQLHTKSGTSSLRNHIADSCPIIGDDVRKRFVSTMKMKESLEGSFFRGEDHLGGTGEVNNAAVSFNEIDTNSVERAETVLRTNFYGAKTLTEALLPLFRRSPTTSRILNISSQLGLLNKVRDPALRRMLLDEAALTERDIEGMASRFLAQVADGTWRGQGWPEVWTDYAVSKLALNAYSRLLAARLAGRGVSVNCFCPGFTRTDMTRGWGKRTADEAGRVAAGLALLPPEDLPTGKFFKWSTPQIYSKL